MKYALLLEGRAERELKTLSNEILRRVDTKLRALAVNPRPRGAQKLKGKEAEGWRVRVGDYRIVEEQKMVLVYRIKHRREAYR